LVRSVAQQPDGKVLIAGEFSTVHGATRGGIARLNADGTTDYTFGNLNGLSGSLYTIYSLAVQSDGKVIIGGWFKSLNGVGRTNIARLNADGTLDASFRNGLAGTDGIVQSVAAQSDGKVLIGGGFSTVDGVSRNGIARLNADGTLDSGSGGALSGLQIRSCRFVVQNDGKLLIGGSFAPAAGYLSRYFYERFNADGSLDSSFLNEFSELYGEVVSLAAQSDGKVLVAGYYTINGVAIDFMERLNADGTLDNGFQHGLSGANGLIVSITEQSDGKLLIGGGFTTVNGVPAAYFARLNGDGSLDSGFQNGLPGANSPVLAVALRSDGKMLIGGYFSRFNGVARNSIARLYADGALDSGFENGVSGADYTVYSLALQNDDKVLVGGYFDTVNGVGRNGTARLNADGTLDRGFQNGLPGTGGQSRNFVDAVAEQSDGKLLVGGDFTKLNGVGRNRIARLNADGTLDSGFQNGLSGPDGDVSSVALQSDGKVFIGGRFTTVNGVSRTNIARLNADGTLDNSFQNGLSGADHSVNSVALQSDCKVLIGGYFTMVNGVARGRIARLNADGTVDNGFQNGLPGADYSVNSVALQSDGKVLIGGYFTMVNGVVRGRIARLNANGTVDNGFQNGLPGVGPPFDRSSVDSIAVQSDGKVLIGGFFYTVNGEDRFGIARLNADGTLDSGFQNGPYGGVQDVNSVKVQSDGKILIGGPFTTVNGVPAAYFARLWGSADIPPLINSITRSTGDVNLVWETIPDRTYRVEYKAILPGNGWTDLAGDVSATGAAASKTDTTLSGAAQRFYRVVLLP
jgi:uncharacterized delta-60 repeat protein